MAWIIGKKSNQSILEITAKLYADDFTLAQLQTIVPSKLGGVVTDYSFYRMTELQSANYSDGQEYTITWASGEISGISFNPELTKPWLKVSSNATNIKDDNIDFVDIRFEVWRADLSGIQTNVNSTDRRVTIITPDGIRFIRLDIVSGVSNIRLKTTKSGEYIFPSEPKRYSNLRIFNQIKIDVDATSLIQKI